MIEKGVAQLRTAKRDVIVADMPLEEALAIYFQIVDEDRGAEVASGVYADESLLVDPLPLIENRNTFEGEVSHLLRTGGDVSEFLAQGHRPRIWRMPCKANIEAVQITFKPYILSGPLNSMGEAIRVARGIQRMDNEIFVDYTRK